MAADEFSALLDSIRAHGQLVPAQVHDGQLLDGRHRARACAELGLPLRTELFDGDDEAARAYVLATNIHRRHLTPSQRAMAAAALATRAPGRAQSGTRAGLTQAEAAATVGVSERTVRDARAVLRDAELTDRVVSGELTVQRAATMLRESLTGSQRSRVLHEVRRETASDEWLTPSHIVERATRALGGQIDLDPCADPARTVPAGRHMTAEEDALGSAPWTAADGSPARAFLNPPYGGSGPGQWVRRLLREHEAGHVSRAILLLPARLGTEWMAALSEWPRAELTGRLCFTAGVGNPAHGQPAREAHFTSVVIGVGIAPGELHAAFGHLGPVMVRLS